jgi:phosphatidylserine decarboxylase
MTVRGTLGKVLQQENLNFLLTNRIPRRLVTQLVGWLSRVEQPVVSKLCIAVWRYFSDVDLSEAKKSRFSSMRDCFTRELREGARPVDPDASVLVSPCDAIVGASGSLRGTDLFQIKGFPYRLEDLVGDARLAAAHAGGRYVTLRLTAGMYHRFHAPYDCRVEEVSYISGDTWNVNPIALKRVERLFCRNERAVIRARLPAGEAVTLVPVAAILVASIRLHCLEAPLRLMRAGANLFSCDAFYRRGEEMGLFEQGSTIVVLAPDDFEICDTIREGATIRMGEALMRLPERNS